MWYKLNQAFGVILLVALVGGGGVYGLYKFVSGPPLLRQEGQPEGQYQKQARKDLEKRLRQLQDQQAESFQRAMEAGRSARGS